MKKLIYIALCLILMGLPALAEEEAEKPTFEPPVLENPETQYEQYIEETDGSESVLFALMDASNDEAADIAAYGALHITENVPLDETGKPILPVNIYLQDSPCGKMMITVVEDGDNLTTVYSCGTVSCLVEGKDIHLGQMYEQEEFDFFTENYHFPYGRLEALNGTRMDENGYTYMLIRSDENTSFEFVIDPENMRIDQLRMYVRDEDGTLKLFSYVDYETCEALEVPDQVLEIIAENLPEPTPAPEDGADNTKD